MPMTLPEDFTGLAVALGVGLLMGIERERRKGSGCMRRLAGVRTFALACVGGALAHQSGVPGIAFAGALLVAVLGFVTHARTRDADPGVTTEVALFVAYVIGVTAVGKPALAAAVGVTCTVLLAARERLHEFSTHWLTQAELRDGLILTALGLVLLPLVPDVALVGDRLNPRRLMELVLLLLAIQAAGHVAHRILGERRGLVVAGLASGFVSATATTATMAGRAVRHPLERSACVRAAIAANLATMVQLLIVALATNPTLLPALWPPALGGAAVIVAFTLSRARGDPEASAAPEAPMAASRVAISLRDALAIAAVLALVQLLAHWLQSAYGVSGLMAAATIAGLADVHAAAAALFMQQGADIRAVALPLAGALIANTIAKLAAARAAGDWDFAQRVAPALGAFAATFAGILWMMVRAIG